MDMRTSSQQRARAIVRVLIGLFVANVAVVVVKLVVGLASGSLAIAGDAVHSSVDAMNNVLALVVIRVSTQAPDHNHPYGHRKFETLGALAIVMFLSVSGFELIRGAVTRLLAGAPHIEISGSELGLLVGTLAVNAFVAMYEARRGRELGSDLLLADAAHTRADVFITVGVIAGVTLSHLGFPVADPVVALVIALVIAAIAWDVLRRAIPVLTDEHVVDPGRIADAAGEVEGVARVYDIRSRGTADQRFAELTIAVAGSASVELAHRIADEVEDRLRLRLDLHEIVIHIEPC